MVKRHHSYIEKQIYMSTVKMGTH